MTLDGKSEGRELVEVTAQPVDFRTQLGQGDEPSVGILQAAEQGDVHDVRSPTQGFEWRSLVRSDGGKCREGSGRLWKLQNCPQRIGHLLHPQCRKVAQSGQEPPEVDDADLFT
jgi:hypothetical protein